jgi:ribosomal protein L10
VAEADAFRGRLASSKLRMQVLKGSLRGACSRRAGCPTSGRSSRARPPSSRPSRGRAWTAPPSLASKTLAAWRKESGKDLPALKGGVLEGQLLDRKAAAGLEKMPGKRDLQARIVAQMLAPGRRLASQLGAGGSRIAGALKTHITNLEKKAG